SATAPRTKRQIDTSSISSDTISPSSDEADVSVNSVASDKHVTEQRKSDAVEEKKGLTVETHTASTSAMTSPTNDTSQQETSSTAPVTSPTPSFTRIQVLTEGYLTLSKYTGNDNQQVNVQSAQSVLDKRLWWRLALIPQSSLAAT